MIKKILLVLLVLFVLVQFINPEKNKSTEILASDFILMENPNDKLVGILKNACYDCHSNNTNYPWYDRITPVNFWVQDHVNHGKEELNFSIWNDYSSKKKMHKIDECIELIEKGEMPLESYTIMHSKANLTEKDKKELIEWLKLVQIKYEVIHPPI